jgi:diguanylate cyclase
MRTIDRKIAELYAKTFRRWSSVIRWSIFGPLLTLAGSCFLTGLIFWGAELTPDAWHRLKVAATAGPLMIALPMFYLFSVRMRRLAVENLRLSRVANIDSLTGCLNRGAFTALTHELLNDNKLIVGGALLVIDADKFKAINDMYGHDQGDIALTLIADTVRRVVRTGALVGRLGGEEFGVYLPGASRLGAFLVAERIRRGIRKTHFAPSGVPHLLSVSVGGASFVTPISFTELFRCADQGLYVAKKAGRNMVEVAAVSLATPTKRHA